MPLVIAIDGPAASGKSSTAAAVARALGLIHLDSGALYRALTWVAAADEATTPAAILAAAEARHVTLRPRGIAVDVHVDGIDDIDAAIRAPGVNANVSAVAAMPEVRDWVNARIRAVLAHLPGAVIDGRDIGTVVVPAATLKVFLTATPEARARRRLAQTRTPIDPGELAAEAARLAERDRFDSSRVVAPLRQAGDAIVIDTSDLGFGDQVAQIIALAHARNH